ncbi:MAG: PH domain-containing protein [Planctomycetales bacterium]|nr:PH domain-containing protein [Planctomycetales bacterium]
MLELVFVAGISIAFGFTNWVGALVMFSILGGAVWFRSKCKAMYRFTFGSGEIRTQKVFTNHIDVTTPVHQIQSVSAYEGILEALLGAGTIEFTTASSHQEHAKYTWPHIHDARTIAEELRVAVASRK